ncbi:MAG: DUF3810 domain-containing protein [Oscillospiraceae bacterium]|nr:DUF3810 domain-containing protein [Oscillospiraceae bacterium]
MKERIRGKGLLLTWPAAGLVLLLAKCSERFAEYAFARGIYRVFHGPVAFLTGLLPVSLAELILYALIPAVLAMLAVWAVHTVRGKGRRLRCFAQGAVRALGLLGLVFFLFVFGCGGNYYRSTYADLSGLEVAPGTDEELYGLCSELAAQANELRAQLAGCEDAQGIFRMPCSTGELGERARKAMIALGKDEPLLSRYYARPKAVLWSRGMSRLGITGVFFPFTQEANVNVDTSDYSVGAAMCHELAHSAGFMREDEANFLAWLACTRQDDPVLAYSGTMLALAYAGNALAKNDPGLYRQVNVLLSDAVRRDRAADRAYWAQFEDTKTNEFGEKMNDTYLKANDQKEGTKSYGAMVDLLLAEYRKMKPD